MERRGKFTPFWFYNMKIRRHSHSKCFDLPSRNKLAAFACWQSAGGAFYSKTHLKVLHWIYYGSLVSSFPSELFLLSLLSYWELIYSLSFPLVLPGVQMVITAPTDVSRRNSMQMLKWSSLKRKAGGWELPKICHRKPLLFESPPRAVSLPCEWKMSCLCLLHLTGFRRFAEVLPALYTVLVLCQVSLLIMGTCISTNDVLDLPLWVCSLLIRVSDSLAVDSSCL